MERLEPLLVEPDRVEQRRSERIAEGTAAPRTGSSAGALRDTIAKRPVAGSPGLMMAMGPGFCSELVMLRWR